MRKSASTGIRMLLPLCCSVLSLQCQPLNGSGEAEAVRLADGLARISQAALPQVPAAPEASYGGPADPAAHHLWLAQHRPMALLEEALARWEPVEAYRLTVYSQERMQGVLGGTAVLEARVLHSPRAVSFRWIENPGRIDRLLYMPSTYGGKLVVRPTGLAGRLVGSVRLDPDDERVLAQSRRNVTQFGLAGTLRGILEDYRDHAANEQLDSQCLGLVACGAEQTPAIVLRRTSAAPDTESRTLLLWLEARSLRPLKVEQYGWNDELLASYRFEDYRPLPLSREDFTLAALDMQ